MQKVTLNKLEQLIQSKGRSPAVTMYIPTNISADAVHAREDTIRFKNLFSKALKILKQRHDQPEFAVEFEKHCQTLMEDNDFWRQTTQSILICARPGMFKHFNLPIDSDEHVSVADHFFLTPVIGVIQDMREYYVLGVAKKEPQLYKGDAYGLEKIEAGLPSSIKEALNIDEMHEKSVQFSSTTRGKAQFHGHGSIKDTGDADRLLFFKVIDEIICKKIDSTCPLILAGVGSEVAEYRAKSKYPNITKGHIEGNHQQSDMRSLHEKAQAIVENEIIAAKQSEILATYGQLHGSSTVRTSESMSDLKDAAEKGRIETLLVGMSLKTRDTVRDSMQQVKKLVFPKDNESQMVNHISQLAFSQSGRVINIPQELMPGKQLMVAINRY